MSGVLVSICFVTLLQYIKSTFVLDITGSLYISLKFLTVSGSSEPFGNKLWTYHGWDSYSLLAILIHKLGQGVTIHFTDWHLLGCLGHLLILNSDN